MSHAGCEDQFNRFQGRSRGVPPRRINEIVKRKRAITATARFTRKGKHSWTWFRKLTLANHGTGAKSKLPEAK